MKQFNFKRQDVLTNNCMKLFCFILFALFLLYPNYTFAHEEPSKTLKEKAEKEKIRERNVHSRIKAVTSWKHDVEKGLVGNSSTKFLLQEYDLKGNLISIASFKNDTLDEKTMYTYDNENNLLISIDLSASGTILETSAFFYDPDGRATSGVSTDSLKKKVGSFVQKYERTNHRITFIKFNAHDSIEYTIEYIYGSDYDSSDYRSAIKKDAGGALVLRADKSYDPRGRMVNKTVMQTDRKQSYDFLYKYGEQNVINEITKVQSDTAVEWTNQYSINNDGTYAELRSYNKSGTLLSYTEYKYEYYNFKK
jgi:hypothetical protein